MSSSIEKIKNEKRLLLNEYLDESNNQTFINQNEDAIFIMDLDVSIVHANHEFEGLTGYSIPEISSLRLQSLVIMGELDKVLNYFHKSFLGTFENFDCKMVNHQNQLLDVNVMTIPISYKNQIVGVFGVAKNITQLKRKKNEVRQIEELHGALTDNILDIIMSTNFLGEILYISPSCKNILGVLPEQLIGKHFTSLFHQDDRDKLVLDRKRILTQKDNGRGTYRVLKEDEPFIWSEILCKPVVDPLTQNIVEVISVIRDISEQKKAEEELRKRKKAFREIIEHSPDGVIITKNNIIKYINEMGLKILGASKEEELINKSALEFLHPDYHQIAITRSKTVSAGEFVDFLEYKLIRMDGTIKEVEIKAFPTVFQDDNANYLYIRDLTDRKKTEKLLLQAEKLRTAGQLAAGIAHEVRNPLTAIKGFLQLMESDLKEKKVYFDIVQSEMARIDLILSELLALAKPKDLNIETIKLQTLIHDVKMLIDTQAIMNNINIEISNDFHNSLLLECDFNQIKQVLINFLKNSIEAMKHGGVITIELKRFGSEKIKIFVKDTGPGLPQHILKRIGEPFFTTKENGTGLGIMISKQIVEHHNGTVHFWSDTTGTIVEIILPIHNPKK